VPTITIDFDICKKDGLCAMTCMGGIIVQEEASTHPKIVDAERCYGCGQCVAICPQNAITHSNYPEGSVVPIRKELIPTYDQLLELIRSRRSKRLFKDMAVEREVIEQIVEAARFAPSGHNEQTTEFVVIQDKEIIREITNLTAEGIVKAVQPLKNPIGRIMMRRAIGKRSVEYLSGLVPELEGLAAMLKDGTDWILRGAPVLILFCADTAGDFFAKVNANLALHNAALAAETLGLGCFYGGFVILAANRSDAIARLISLPETHQIYGALALGYPRLQFSKWPDRNPARVTWIGAG
jgi:nitroreductase/NAD-dependent dihydropyrimidine dehydrogenase PreA subunit